MALVLDTGGLIAFDRGNREVAAIVEVTRRRREQITTSSGCVAQAWRRDPRQALLARLLRGVGERGLTDDVSRRLGELCGDTASNDVVDAHVALLARDGDLVLTSDPRDLRALLRATGSTADIKRC